MTALRSAIEAVIFYTVLVQLGIYYLRLVAFFFQSLEDLLLVVSAIRFHGDPQFHRCISVDRNKLIMFQLDDVTVLIGDGSRYFHKFSGLVRQQYRYGEDAILLDQAVLHDGGHSDHIHVAAA